MNSVITHDMNLGTDGSATRLRDRDRTAPPPEPIALRDDQGARNVLDAGNVRIYLDTQTVEIEGQRVHFTCKEYELLQLLMRCKGRIVTREMFLNELYRGKREPALKIFDVLICKIRGKLRAANDGRRYIETVWGRGYKLQEPVDAAPR